MKRKTLYDYILSLGFLAFDLAILIVLWPLDKTKGGYFLILLGLTSIVGRSFIPEGIEKTKWTWSSEERKQRMLWGGLATVAIGLLILFIK